MSTLPHFLCTSCSHEWDADKATDGCPSCGERTVRLSNFFALCGSEARAPTFAGCSGDRFRKVAT